MKVTEERREYLRAYQTAWIKRRRRAWIRNNGPCKTCSSLQRLEVDHVDPSTKEYEVASIWSLSFEKRIAELAKCQVLCYRCHKRKTSHEASLRRKPIRHGFQTAYRYGCRCELCVIGYASQRKTWPSRTKFAEMREPG